MRQLSDSVRRTHHRDDDRGVSALPQEYGIAPGDEWNHGDVSVGGQRRSVSTGQVAARTT